MRAQNSRPDNGAHCRQTRRDKAEVTYNAAADHFDDGPLAFWDRYGRRTVERLFLSPGSLVLDVGCGSGAAAIKVGPHGRVIGIDLAGRLLDIARTKSIAQKLHNIDFRWADMAAELSR
jgi:ubiquinone/menaquinone biosynthesis C-methylase UbiE